jgi:hypothetical protein
MPTITVKFKVKRANVLTLKKAAHSWGYRGPGKVQAYIRDGVRNKLDPQKLLSP